MQRITDHEHLLEIALEAALKAGGAIMEVYAGATIEVVSKEDHSPLTLADERADEIIRNLLSVSGIPVLSEESLKQPWTERQQWDRCWIVDPLDGTKEFIRRNGEFTVNIALAVNGTPVLGVILAPATGELWFGNDGKGAYKARVHQPDCPVKEVIGSATPIRNSSANSGGMTVVASRSHRNPETDAFIAGLEKENHTVNIISRGSSLKFCMVAEGQAQVYPRYAPTMEWDTAAGQAIAAAAGCRITDVQTGEPLQYNKEDLRNPWFIVIGNDFNTSGNAIART